MLQLTIQATECWDEQKQEFVCLKKDQKLQLEHSLVSVSKWESKWGKAFLSPKEKTFEETIDYIRCMTITQNVPDTTYTFLTHAHINIVNEYIAHPMTATVIRESIKENTSKEVVTAELIYYWMIAFQIPLECQKWHLNRLLTLIKVCNVKNKPPKKQNQKEIMVQNHELNERRKQEMQTRG
ncbi:MAG: hypothetical protein R3Y53_02040 [Bacillota bacterium]